MGLSKKTKEQLFPAGQAFKTVVEEMNNLQGGTRPMFSDPWTQEGTVGSQCNTCLEPSTVPGPVGDTWEIAKERQNHQELGAWSLDSVRPYFKPELLL